MNFFVYIWVITTIIKVQNIPIIPKGDPQITSVVIFLLQPPNPANPWHEFCSDNTETNPDANPNPNSPIVGKHFASRFFYLAWCFWDPSMLLLHVSVIHFYLLLSILLYI